MCNAVRCSFIKHYFTTCFGLNGHLQVYSLLYFRTLLLTVIMTMADQHTAELPPQQEHSRQPQPVNRTPAHSRTPAPTRTLKAATTSKPKASTQQNSRPNKNTQGSHNQETEQNQKQPRARHITKIRRGSNNKRKETAIQ
jgi:hypothetical protein